MTNGRRAETPSHGLTMILPNRCVKPLLLALGILLVQGCAHATRATVVMKVSDDEAHIGLGSKEVGVGDHVSLFENRCERPSLYEQGVRTNPVCTKIKIGEATVARVLNDQYSVVKVEPGIKFEEGTVVEKG